MFNIHIYFNGGHELYLPDMREGDIEDLENRLKNGGILILDKHFINCSQIAYFKTEKANKKFSAEDY